MPVTGLLSFALEVPDIAEGVRFYEATGLIVEMNGDAAHFRCSGRARPSISLTGGAPSKRLHHVTLAATEIDELADRARRAGGEIVDGPQSGQGVWVKDPHGTLFHVVADAGEPSLEPTPPFEINAPGRIIRKGRSAILPGREYGPVRPLRLGHVLLFSPDVQKSVDFVTDAFGMGLADRAQEVIAFCCTRTGSDHHVLAFARSEGIGLHHASFQVRDPDEVGRGGRALHDKAKRGEWGFGRHTIGSNFFHYIQDPWGSWFEYYSDMDFIEDYAAWTPSNYAMEDSLASWGPAVPHDFVHNYEVAA